MNNVPVMNKTIPQWMMNKKEFVERFNNEIKEQEKQLEIKEQEKQLEIKEQEKQLEIKEQEKQLEIKEQEKQVNRFYL